MFFYSFTQVDLSLTLSQWSVWQVFEKFFQHIGYFQRPLSSFLFLVTVLMLLAFYLLILQAIKKGKIAKNQVWFLIISVTMILTFSYNAFSYDLFNYIFDAKIVTHYHQSPYVHKALDYAGDPMLSFMHWTHRTYPYGPIWLILTIPLSFIGSQVFLLTFFLFKALASLSFLGTAFFISKILKKVSKEKEVFGLAFFALNPLVVIESLVSSHNDIVMIFFAMFALYLLMNKKIFRSLILLFLSIGVKFASLFLLPVFLLDFFAGKLNKKLDLRTIFLFSVFSMVIPIFLASIRTNFQPWYLLLVLPFVALVPKYYLIIPGLTFSIISLLQYLPFLYLGNWNDPVPSVLSSMIIISVILSIIFVVMWFLKLSFVRRS